MTSGDLGVLGDLSTALGIMQDGSPDPNWFGDPSVRLKTVLSDDGQRDALVKFLDSVLDDGAVDVDAQGRAFVPIVTHTDPDLVFGFVLEPTATTVRVGLGVEVSTSAVGGGQSRPATHTRLDIALFQTARGNSPAPDPVLLLGHPGGRIRLESTVDLDPGAPPPGEFHLGGIGVHVDVPTTTSGDDPPSIGLKLKSLQLPGGQAKDFDLGLDSAEHLEDTVVELVLGLIQAQAATDAGPLRAVAGLLGLTDDLPPLPIEQLLSTGVAALTAWLEGILSDSTNRAAWLGLIAGLLPGAAVHGDAVEVTFGVATCRFRVRTEPGPSGHLRVVPSLDVEVGGGGAAVQATVDLFRTDLGSGATLALPRLGLWAHLGRSDGGAEPLALDLPAVAPTPAVRIEAVRVGMQLDDNRRPTFVLAADRVEIGSHEYPTLDLTSTDALMDAAGAAVDDVLGGLLDALGDAGDAARLLLGIGAPPGHPAVPTITLPALAADPLGAVRGYWQTLLTAHPDAFAELLGVVRDVIGSAPPGAAVAGTGTEVDPWRLPLVTGFEVQVFAAGSEVHVSVAGTTRVDTLGARCTVIEGTFALEVATIDLDGGHASVMTGLVGALSMRGRGLNPERAVLDFGAARLEADRVGIAVRWRPTGGLRFELDAPNLGLVVGDTTLPLPLPVPGQALDAAMWTAVERLIGAIAPMGPPWLASIVGLLGWSDVSGGTGRLALADLFGPTADAPAAIRAWLGAVAVEIGTDAVAFLSELLTGAAAHRGVIDGTGTPDHPFALALADGPLAPELLVWFPPDGPAVQPAEGIELALIRVGDEITAWRPGDVGLASEVLATALTDEATVAPDLADLIWNRDLTGGLEGLVARWTGGDGRIVPPVTAPAGVDVSTLPDVAAGQLAATLDLDQILDHEPPAVIHVRIATDAPAAFPDAPPDRVIDLTAGNRAPETFTAPTPAAGDWFVALAPRAVAALTTGDADGSVGQAARLERILSAFAGLGAGQVVVGEGGAGHAARSAAAAVASISDVVTLGSPLGPVSLTVLDEAGPGDLWRFLAAMAPADSDADDDDLARGRALVGALAEVDPAGDPAGELRPPAGGFTDRAGLGVHAVFGVVGEPAVRRSITALVAAGLAGRARARAATGVATATGIRAGLRARVTTGPTDPLVVDGHVTIDLGGFDFGSTGMTAAVDRAVRMKLRLGARGGWLAGGPDPLRAPGKSREHALRAVTVDVTVPRGAGSTATAAAQLLVHDGRAFDVVHERLEVQPTGEAVGAEVRLLLSLAVGRIVAEATAVVPSPAAAGLRSVVEALQLVAADGSIADAIEQLLHDPVALVGEALDAAPRRETLAAGARALIGAIAPTGDDDPASIRIATDTVTVVADLTSRSLTLDAPEGGGRFGWAAHASFTPSTHDWWVRLGTDAAASPAGSVWVRLEPGHASLHWRAAGTAAPTDITLWPTLDAAPLGDLVVHVAPALFGQVALDLLRRGDETARPIVDAALGAFGLVDGVSGDLRLPVGLVQDPAGWLRHPGALGSDPARLVALIDAVKPLLGLAGGPGELAIVPGVTLVARDAGGAFELQATVDTTQFALPPATPLGHLVGGLTASIRIPGSGPPHVGIDLSLGLDGAGAGRKAIHVALDDHLTVFLRPATGPDIGLYPTGPGVGAAASAALDAASHALPFLLDKVAEQTGNNLQGHIGAVVAGAGDALGLRDGTHHFTYELLAAFAADPVASLTASAAGTFAAALQALTDALGDALPPDVSVTKVGQALRVEVGPATLTWTPAPFRIELEATATTFPVLDHVAATLALNAAGLDELSLAVGPVPLPVGPIELRPVLAVHAGAHPAGGRRVELGLDLDGTRQVVGQWLFDPMSVRLAVLAGGPPIVDPGQVALTLAEAVTGLAASIALAADDVQHLLATQVGSKTVKELLHGVVLKNDDTLDPQVFAIDELLTRVARLLDNLASADLSITVDGALTIGIAKTGGGAVGINLGLTQRFALVEGDVSIWLEVDDSWIDPLPDAPGITLGVVELSGNTVTFDPSLTIAGVGIRVGKSSGPLLDLGVTLESVAVHLYGEISPTGLSGGVQLQLTNLGVAVSGASGGNAIASGIVGGGGSAGQKPKPAFSPSLAVQKHDGNPVEVTLRAGDGDGPWWIAIQKGFGPLYLEQVGFGVTMPQRRVESISLLLDARVSLFGLNASVDDLSITYFVADGNFFEAKNWKVDLGGLAISAEIGPLAIAGGLLKNGGGDDVEYLGMLLGRFGVYGLTIYGGYGKKQGTVSFFAIGAVVGPIGGVPAFFVTGIGGGFGINRRLIIPTDLSRFGDYPLIQALDPGASPPADPMAQLRSLGDYFPTEAGTFWFAAGISFNSFALVDGVCVIAMQFGDGFEFNLLGLARMALPRPQVAIVSIELALVVRISSKEGVIWVQAQLTDNSWLLYSDVRLTGGFAYVVWFAGPKRGEFVLTMGGFHPDFHRDGYPVVPRLGLQWSIGGAIVVKGGAYFALTSEAVMAGIDVEVSAHFGWAWASLSFGAHGIVFFDPFHYKVTAYVRISAGITIDTWFGDISFSISCGAQLTVEGPDFHGKAEVEVGPCSVTVPFGSQDDNSTPRLTVAQFVPKYLDEAVAGVARAISSIVSAGAIPPHAGAGPAAEPPDGTAGRPFVVTAEFVMTVTTTVPATAVDVDGSPKPFAPTHVLGIGPMGVTNMSPPLTMRWQQDAGVLEWPFAQVTPMPYGAFPLGIWGPPQDAGAPKIPTGEVVAALSQVQLTARAVDSGGGPPVDYNRLDPKGPRRPLPFLRNSGAARTSELNQARAISKLVANAAAGGDVVELADSWRAGAGASPIELASWKNERRTVAPLLGSLADRLAKTDVAVVPEVGVPIAAVDVDASVHAPVALALLGAGTPLEGARNGGGTTVSDRVRAKRVAPPSVAGLRNVPAAARLVVGGGGVQRTERSVTPTDTPAVTRAARVAGASITRRGGPGRARLDGMTAALGGDKASGTTVRAGEVAVLALPNAAHDVDSAGERPNLALRGCPTRVVMLAHGGRVVADELTVDAAVVVVPQGAERIVVAPTGTGVPTASLAGWHGGMTLPYVGWDTALAIDSTVHVDGSSVTRRDDRYRAGWTEAAELVDGTATVTTRFNPRSGTAISVVVVAIDDPSADAGRRLLLGLDGAEQVAGADGKPLPPTVLVTGNRTILAYRVASPIGTAAGGAPAATPAPIEVTIASGTGWHLVGVLAGTGDPTDVVATIAARGFDSVLGTAATGPGQVDVRWQGVPGAGPARPSTPRRPRPHKKQVVKKRPVKKRAVQKQAAKKQAAKKRPVENQAAKKTSAKKRPVEKQAAEKTSAKKRGRGR